MIVAPGQGHDGQMLPDLLDEIRVPRLGPGRPRATPDKVLGNKAYFSRATRTLTLGGMVGYVAGALRPMGAPKKPGQWQIRRPLLGSWQRMATGVGPGGCPPP